MKEIEIKAHATLALKDEIDRMVGSSGTLVEKDDLYFRRPGESLQALRIRVDNGEMEFTAKKQHLGERSEDNLEYEIHLDKKEMESAIQFFECLGFEKYFRKHKRGFSWHYEGIHIELLEVNDLGAFLEMEVILPFEANESAVSSAQDELYSIIDRFGLSDQIERTSYREMILNGIQSKPHTCK